MSTGRLSLAPAVVIAWPEGLRESLEVMGHMVGEGFFPFVFVRNFIYLLSSALGLHRCAGLSPPCAGFSSWWRLLWQRTGSRVRGLQGLRLPSSRRGMWDLPGSRIEPGSPPLPGRFFYHGATGVAFLQKSD